MNDQDENSPVQAESSAAAKAPQRGDAVDATLANSAILNERLAGATESGAQTGSEDEALEATGPPPPTEELARFMTEVTSGGLFTSYCTRVGSCRLMRHGWIDDDSHHGLAFRPQSRRTCSRRASLSLSFCPAGEAPGHRRGEFGL